MSGKKLDLSSIKNYNVLTGNAETRGKKDIKKNTPRVSKHNEIVQTRPAMNARPAMNFDIMGSISKSQYESGNFDSLTEKTTKNIANKKVTRSKKSMVPKDELSERDRHSTIKLLELYVQSFPDDLEKYKGINFTKCKDAELLKYKQYFMDSSGTRDPFSGIKTVANTALPIIEQLARGSGIDLTGLSELTQSDDWDKNLKRLGLKYAGDKIMDSGPEGALMYMIFTKLVECYMRPKGPSIHDKGNNEILNSIGNSEPMKTLPQAVVDPEELKFQKFLEECDRKCTVVQNIKPVVQNIEPVVQNIDVINAEYDDL